MTNTEFSPVSLVIFGASGDLTYRKLAPALFSLFCKGRLPERFEVTGFAMDAWDEDSFRQRLYQGLKTFAAQPFSEEQWAAFAAHLHYQSGNFTRPADYQALKARLQAIEGGPVGRMYYLATPPQFFTAIPEQLAQAGMVDEQDGWRRVVIEKPFGTSFETAHSLNQRLHASLHEDQIFRIDHYLGKETVQNLLVFRFANVMFEPVWSRDYIDHVQISVLEEVGVGHRGGYYDHAGVLRDMFQNHLLQLLTLVAIEQPDTLTHRDLHARKLEVLQSIHPMNPEEVKQNTVRGQYHGYRATDSVDPDSQTATFAAARLWIDSGCWEGVPFYLRSGKSLGAKCTEIVITYQCPPNSIAPMPPKDKITPNVLAFCIQPDEGIFLRFEAKVPDTEAEMRSVEMEFHYKTSFDGEIPEAYERLLLEVMQGDQSLFVQDDITEAAWRIIDPILAAWDGPDAPPLEPYDPGSYGPDSAARLINRDGREWQLTCGQHPSTGLS